MWHNLEALMCVAVHLVQSVIIGWGAVKGVWSYYDVVECKVIHSVLSIDSAQCGTVVISPFSPRGKDVKECMWLYVQSLTTALCRFQSQCESETPEVQTNRTPNQEMAHVKCFRCCLSTECTQAVHKQHWNTSHVPYLGMALLLFKPQVSQTDVGVGSDAVLLSLTVHWRLISAATL